MSTQAAGISMGKMAQVYAVINGKVNELNKQVTAYNIKAAAKATLVYMTFFAAGLFAAVASSMLLGVSFPAAISWQVLTGATIGFGAYTVFLQTFGKNMFIKMRSKQWELSQEMTKEIEGLANKIDFNITKAFFENAYASRRSKKTIINAGFYADSYFYGIKKLQLVSCETFEKRLIENAQRQQRIEERKRKTESGFYSYLPNFIKARI